MSSLKKRDEQALIDALNEAFDASVTGSLNEKEALEVALSVADGWRMRFDELESEGGA